jgi:predicted metalloprotease
MARPSRATTTWRLLTLLAAAVFLGGCTTTVAGSPRAGDGVLVGAVDTAVVHGADGSEVDELATATMLDLQSYWRSQFEPALGKRWRDLAGGFYSVDSTDADAAPPPCVQQAIQVEGNAFYCPRADAVAWDRAALFPVLREQHGDGGIVLVLAHEVGHAVHNRLGITPVEQHRYRDRFPTILTEAMADCYAGAFVHWVVDGHAEHLRLHPRELDQALGALVTFRDPVGSAAEGSTAHGNAFDRVSAFQDGYRQGPRLCAGFTMANRWFTQQQFRNTDDAVRGGNLPYRQMVATITPDLERYFGQLVTGEGGRWRSPQVRREQAAGCTDRQGPAAFCPATGGAATIGVSDELPALHDQIGDYATGVLLASRYGLAARQALGKPTEGAIARRSTLCLAGAYTGDLLGRERGFGLSPGDLDEAVQVLLGYDYASRDLSGEGMASGFDRVNQFRAGALSGASACNL